MNKLFSRLKNWWGASYDIKIRTEDEMRRGGLIGYWGN